MNTDDLTPYRFYAGEEHQPFFWNGDAKAALFVHGFPGTPAEMRLLGRALNDDGWTVLGILLPGFGSDIQNIGHQSVDDWLATITNAVETLAAEHDKVVIIGNSLGAALSVSSAQNSAVEGLVLLSPFLRIDNRLIDAIFPILPHIKRNMRPFEKADFDDPQTRESIERFLTDIDLEDASVQETLRSLPLPLSAIGQVRKAGRLALRSADTVNQSTLILQGSHDDLAHPKFTRELARKLPQLTGYIELNGGHNLLDGNNDVRCAVLHFTRRFLHQLGNRRGVE